MAHDDCAWDNMEKLMDELDREKFIYVDTTWGNDETPSITVTFHAAMTKHYMDLQIFVPDCYDFKEYQVIDHYGTPLFENASVNKLIRFLLDQEQEFRENYG
mgnify:CR=1 FL=1|jgi:hypothetical protein